MSFIEVKNLSKTFKVMVKDDGLSGALKSFFNRKYKYINAVNDINFSIKKGEIVGYIGPNGAGKSTTIKMLSGILIPTSGSIKVGKMIPYINRKNYVKNIGVVFGQKSQLWWDIPANDTFNLLKDIYDIPLDKFMKIKDYLINKLKCQDFINVPVRQLSLGQRMRLEIVASLLHEPDILFLDEPTIGLDAVSKQIVRDFIKQINKEKNVTVILTTHDMSDIEALAKRIILIGKGSILYDGSIKTLKEKYDYEKIISICTKDKLDVRKKGMIAKEKTKEGYKFVIDTRLIKISEFLSYVSKKAKLDDARVENSNIDNIIIKLYKEFGI